MPGGLLTALMILAAAVTADAAQSESAPLVRNVLVLQSFERGFSVFDRFAEEFHSELAARTTQPVTISQFVVNPAGFVTPPDEASIRFLQSAFVSGSKPDLVVTVGGPAAAFARRHRQELFPDTPFLFSAVERRFLGDGPLAANEAAVTVTIDYVLMIEDILQLLPKTRSVFIVMGAGSLSRFWRTELERNLEPFAGRLTFVWSDALTYGQILDSIARLPPDSAIIYFAGGTFAQGGWQSEERAFADISQRGRAPLFGVQSVWLGMGIVGGRLLFTDDLGRVAAGAAVRILNGESPTTIRIEPLAQARAVFDAQQLRKWNIPETRLPRDSDVRFRDRSLWRDYRREVLAALGVVSLQSLLIAGLVYQRHARRRAEMQSRTNLALAADANRRVTMAAMTGSIAHELSQPLNAIQHNAQAGEMMIGSNRGTPEVLKEILADIRIANTRASEIIERHRTMLKSREVAQRRIDLHTVVRESVAFVGHDSKSKQVQVDVDPSFPRCVVSGDQVLLQQVFVNVIMNAMDAMDATPVGRRRILVTGTRRQEHVEVSIRDHGTGLSAEVGRQVFEAFVTTKRNGIGIGLTIARAIIEAHRGTMAARNNADGGATFTITLPCERPSASG